MADIQQKHSNWLGWFYCPSFLKIGSGSSVADDLDVGAVIEGKSIHMAVLGDTYFGEVGAITESIFPNLRHRWGDRDTR